MDTTTLILSAVAALLLAIAFSRQRDLPLAGLVAGGRTLWRNLPILLLGFVIAGLVQVIVPREVISRWLGAQVGVKGILTACVAGGLMPGAPYAVFPLAAVLYQSGAGMGAVVGFLTAWALWSVSRLPVEMALVDPKVALVRYAITFVIPPIAGLGANLVAALL
ncbi:MAG TPA: hypothetical protein G4N99_13895 [Thermoflexia bacterium]|nr:hypothetical protein [Thermoflexia bacterium]